MPQPRVFVTRRLPQEALDLLAAETELEVWPGDEHPPRDVLLSRARGCDAMLTTIEDRIDEELLAAGKGRLKVVANCAVGFDNVDLQSATQHGIAASNTPQVLTKTTADLAFALILAVARRVVEGDRDVRAGQWNHWRPFAYAGPDVHGSTLSILGMGQIGLEVAKRAFGFEMAVYYYDPIRRPEAERQYGVRFCHDLPSALKVADFVSVHTPLTPETRHMIGQKELRLMKPTAILVNTSRGPVVDNTALYEALRDGIIAGAGLDVTEPEPIPADHPLLSLSNVVITPHIGSASLATRTAMALLAARNILARLKGEDMPTCLNPEVLNR
ncbi:MAG: D-glycerate dehydrogenase [Dehalococcoidia bacterium]|nr:D-glycerate dehydrogenase [Dehalococcoidia bacterium]